ncbi:MAG: CatB-related O-acetyltransferase [Helicobacter sp.]|nr:CatB-related O-acetyltransferase [Helicobacter sp.]
MEIIVNSFVREYLGEFNVQGRMGHCYYGDGASLIVPESGAMEEYCSINRGNVLCQMGSLSYSNAPLKRADIKMGRYCSIAVGLDFIAGKHPLHLISTSSCTYDPYFYIFRDSFLKHCGEEYSFCSDWSLAGKLVPPPPPTILENDVYVCQGAILKPGITLHTGSVVAQNAIVTKDVPPYAIVGGAPARVLKYRFSEDTIKRLLRLKWWEYHFSDFRDISLFLDINEFLDKLESKILRGEIKPFSPKKMEFSELIQRSRQNRAYRVDCHETLRVSRNDLVDSVNVESQIFGAKERVKNQLSYKLGQILIKDSKSLSGILKMPFSLIKANLKHKRKVRENMGVKLPSLESYADFLEAKKCKNHLSYKLGSALIKAHKSWYKGGYVWFVLWIFKNRLKISKF